MNTVTFAGWLAIICINKDALNQTENNFLNPQIRY